MKLFLYEYANGLGSITSESLADSILQEGGAMLAALAHDAVAIADCKPITLVAGKSRQSPAAPMLPDDCEQVVVETTSQHDACFRQLCAASDFAIVIAPEFDDHLASLTRLAEDSGARLACPGSPVIAAASDKRRLNEILRNGDIPATRNWLFEEVPAELPFPCIVKPRFGAGSQDVRLVGKREALSQISADYDRLIVEEFAPGRAVSVAVIASDSNKACLPAMDQHLSDDGRFQYEGGSGPISAKLNQRAQRLAGKAIELLLPTQGYLGVDIVLGADGSGDRIIEINPRLTTSYLGLRQVCQNNLLEVWLKMVAGEIIDVNFHEAKIHFSANDVPIYCFK